MRILGIETSCDETSVCLLSVDGKKVDIKSHVIVSQAKLHEKYGGVVPELAAREHLLTFIPALTEAGITPHTDFDAIAVTVGPGLVASLMIGVEAAKTLSILFKKPLIKINHIEGHIYSPFLEVPLEFDFPYLALIVSGGHTELILMRDHGLYELIGRTRDDAVGEAFDKIAKLLKLPYPGGPHVSKRALLGDKNAYEFPRPMRTHPGFDFSFAGLKTSVVYKLEDIASVDDEVINNICASFEEACVDVLTYKTMKAAKEYGINNIILAGGVSANGILRERIQKEAEHNNCSVYISPLNYTGDNAAMIACAGYFHAIKEDYVDPYTLEAESGWELV